MKIISYNISTCKQWKIDRLLDMDADVFVVPEIACPEQVVITDDLQMAWNGVKWEISGKQHSKGLGIIWKKGHGMIPEWYNPNLTFAIPLIYDEVLVLAFWPTKCKGISDRMKYPQIAQMLIDYYKPFLMKKTSVVIGDFNCCVNQSDYSKKYGDMRQVNEHLEACGLFSLYHKKTGETIGEESSPTYYHRFNINQPFMLDYAYTNKDVEYFHLLEADLKMSDHVGLKLDI